MIRFKNIIPLLFVLLCAACSSSSSNSKDFSQGWEFRLGEMDSNFFESDKQSNDGWQEVSIPHDWSIESGYTTEKTSGSNAFLPGGIGWYRKAFDLTSEMKGKSVVIRFEGVYNNSQVWINGTDLGFYPNGYLDFEYDLTPYLKNRGNILTVRVDRHAYADARWYVGAGIYRPVHLIVRNESYIPSHGQLITSSEVSAKSAKVNIATDITNSSSKDESYQLNYAIMDGDNIVENGTATLDAKAGTTATASSSVTITAPKLWCLKTPNVYTLRTSVKSGDVEICQAEEMFGIRTIKFDASKGFLLNGESVKIKGVNIHHDLGSLGVALYDDALHRRLKALKSVGVNAIRTAHNPHSESLVKMCDTMGFVVMNEIFDEWREAKNKIIECRAKVVPVNDIQMGYSAHFDEWAERDVKKFVRRDFNSPSVVMWSIGNEIEWTYKYYSGASLDKRGYQGLIFTGKYESNPQKTKERFEKLTKGKDELSETARELSKWVKDVDTSRPVTSGVVVPSVSHISGYTDALDVVGYNYKHTYYEPQHKLYPNIPIIGSENVGQYYEWKAVMDKPYVPGIFLWTGVDYLGENGPWPAKGGTYSLFDFATFKTPRGHFFETLWCDTPKTYIVTTPAATSEFKLQKDGSFKSVWDRSLGFIRRWLWFECYEKWKYEVDEEVVVQVYTNAPKAELLLNGKSLGIKNRADFTDENILLWQVPFESGDLVAVGLDNSGKELSRYQLSTAGTSYQLNVIEDRTNLRSNGSDIAHIEIEQLDSQGYLVVDGDQEITIGVDDKLEIVGVDNGSDKFVGSHQSNKINTYNGRALIIVKPVYGAKGKARVSIETANKIYSTVYFNIK